MIIQTAAPRHLLWLGYHQGTCKITYFAKLLVLLQHRDDGRDDEGNHSAETRVDSR